MDYGTDKRISRLRTWLHGTAPTLGDQIGDTWTDTALTGICDYKTFRLAWDRDAAAAYATIMPTFGSADTHGVAVLDADEGAIMPFVSSGFGDGEFPVNGLVVDSRRVGVEIEFIKPDQPYALG
jgi:hypothetical protein